MYELEMNGQVVELNFGMGFLREINKTVSAQVDGLKGVSQNIGLKYKVSQLLDSDVEALSDVIEIANKGCEPRVTKGVIDAFIESDNTDINEVFEKVLGFLKTANATKKVVLEIEANVEKEKKKQEAMEKAQMEAMKKAQMEAIA